jgi:hypothetical protein
MTAYPEDVMKAAREVVAAGIPDIENWHHSDKLAVIQAAARAILAERERAAKVAHEEWMEGTPVSEIAAAIRKGDAS